MSDIDPAYDYIDHLVRQSMIDMCIPGMAVAVTGRDELLWASAHGLANIASGTPVTTETLFEIGSLGKPFTVIALLRLRDEGRLDLDEPVAQYLPWFQVQSPFAPIKVRHLLNHTAGIPRGTDIAPHGLYEAWALRDLRVSAAPGEHFSYSNIGYKIVGFLVERLTGRDFSSAILSGVLSPLGMSHTNPVTTMDTWRRTATGYTSIYDDRPEHLSHPLVPAVWAEYGTGDGAQVSNVGDMAAYLRMLLNRGVGPHGRVITEESFDLMTANGVWTGGDFYGFGLATYTVDGRTYIGHGGGNAGFRSALVVDVPAGLGVVLLANRMGETDPLVEVAQRALTAVRLCHEGGAIPALPPVMDRASVPDAADFAGVYRSRANVLHLTAADGRLYLEQDDTRLALERRNLKSFYVGHPGFDLALLEFGRHDLQVVEAFHGGDWYVNDFYSGPRAFDYPPVWEAYVGHYRTRSPELSNFRVAIRKGELRLLIPWGDTIPLVRIGERAFRIGADPQSPETLRFEAIVEGRALRADYSGCPFYRTFTP